jgi:hypothetical protein
VGRRQFQAQRDAQLGPQFNQLLRRRQHLRNQRLVGRQPRRLGLGLDGLVEFGGQLGVAGRFEVQDLLDFLGWRETL